MIRIQSPTRVDLSGGTLDCWPLSVFVPQAVTVNLAIDIQTSVELETLESSEVEIDVPAVNFQKKYSHLSAFINEPDDSAHLIREVVKAFESDLTQLNVGFRLKTFSDSPIGGGLGGSSSLCISLIKAFSKFLADHNSGHAISGLSSERTVELAHNIEARVLHTPTGTQDYVPALLGGLNFLHYENAGLRIEDVSFDAEAVNKYLGLVYTGKPHHSGINNWQVIKKAVEKDKQTLDCLREISEVSLQISEVCRSGSWGQLPELLNKECDARIALSPVFTSPEIEDLRASAFDLGAQASKICGAGGGGCVLVWADQEVHGKLNELCRKRNYQHLKIKAVPRRPRKA